jgi:hypothetical protein
MKDDENVIDLNEAKARLKAANDYETNATVGAEPDDEDEAPESGPGAAKLKQLRKNAKTERLAILKELNSEYAVVYDGGKAWVLRDTFNTAFERRVYHFMRASDLALLYANRNSKAGNQMVAGAQRPSPVRRRSCVRPQH